MEEKNKKPANTIEELFKILELQIKDMKDKKCDEIKCLKKQRISDIKEQKKKLSDGLVYHKQPFKSQSSVSRLFHSEKPLVPQPIKPQAIKFKPDWLPTYTKSRVLSPCPIDTEPKKQIKEEKQKLWRPFSSQPNRMNQVQVAPPSAKDECLSASKNLSTLDNGQKWVPVKPFFPVRRVASAFPCLN